MKRKPKPKKHSKPQSPATTPLIPEEVLDRVYRMQADDCYEAIRQQLVRKWRAHVRAISQEKDLLRFLRRLDPVLRFWQTARWDRKSGAADVAESMAKIIEGRGKFLVEQYKRRNQIVIADPPADLSGQASWRTTTEIVVSSKSGTMKYSQPKNQEQWAEIFGVSPPIVRKWVRDKSLTRKYHFDAVSDRLWRLPIVELPAEYILRQRPDEP